MSNGKYTITSYFLPVLQVLRQVIPVSGSVWLRLVRWLLLLAGGIGVWACVASTAAAQALSGTVTVRPEAGFGRVVFAFAEPVTANARVTGGVLVVTFDRPVNLLAETVAAKLPAYVAAVRTDPDQRSIRFALVQQVRADLKDAAEQMFLDLMPLATWRGPPPPLPNDVAVDLARRARTVRETIAEAAREKAKPPLPVLSLSTADSDTRKRVVFALPKGVTARLEKDGGGGIVHFEGPMVIDPAVVRAALTPLLADVVVEESTIRFRAPEASGFEGDAEEGAFVLDLMKPRTRAAIELPKASSSVDVPVQTAAEAAPVSTAPRHEQATLRMSARIDGDAVHLGLTPQVPLAVFERAGALWLVASGTRATLVPRLDGDLQGHITGLESTQNDGWSLIRLVPAKPGLVAVEATEEGWRIAIGPNVAAPTQPVRFQRMADADGRRFLSSAVANTGEPIVVEDVDGHESLSVMPLSGAVRSMPQRQRFAEFELIRTFHGVALVPFADDVGLSAGLDRVIVRRPAGLALSEEAVEVTGARASGEGLLNAAQWNSDRNGSVREAGRGLMRAAADAPRRGRTPARMRLVEFYLANGFAEEAYGVLQIIQKEDAVAGGGRDVALMSGLAAAMRGNFASATKYFSHPALALEPEGLLWRAYSDAKAGRFGAALTGFRQSFAALDRSPDSLQAMLRPAVIEAALAGGDTYLAGQQLGEIERMDGVFRDAGFVALQSAKIADASGAGPEALALYRAATQTQDRGVEAEARLGIALTRLALGDITEEQVQADLETVAMIWRRGEVEVRARVQLAELMVRAGAWRDAFAQVRRAVEILPDHPMTKAMQAEASRRFTSLFLEGRADALNKVQALAIFDEFRWLIPPGGDGDDIVTRLAERLYDLDLIDQATELLDHQVAHRLKGFSRARVATRLALMQIINGKPQQALTALRASRLANLPDETKRARLLIEARALSDLSRGDLALEVLAPESGPDVERLRADIHWRAKRWREASETYERGLGQRWQEAPPLTDGERADVLRAGIGYLLAGEKLGGDRLRTKFLPLMAESADAAAFKLVTLDHLSRPDAFRDLARRTVSAETIGSFLESYRKRYPDIGVAKPAAVGG